MNSNNRVKVLYENHSGRNELFIDCSTGRAMSRITFVEEIECGNYPGYHIRVINGIRVPCSNPDEIKSNNLG